MTNHYLHKNNDFNQSDISLFYIHHMAPQGLRTRLFSASLNKYIYLPRLLLLPAVLTLNTAYSQNYWAQGAGGGAPDEALDVVTDTSGNHYITGYFSASGPFGPNILNSAGQTDVFIMKYNQQGFAQWSAQGGGSAADRGLGVASDHAGNVYVTGYYTGSATFGSVTLNATSNSQDIFVAKYNASGILQWAQSFGGNLADQGNAIAADPSGDIIITGQFRGSVTFGTTTLTSLFNPATLSPSIDVFTVKISPSGAVLWAEQGAARFTDRGLDVATAGDGSIYVAGQFSDTITFDNTHGGSATNTSFLIKYNSSGQEQWFREISGSLFSITYGISVNSTGHVFITGDFGGTLAFSGASFTLTNPYPNRIFIARYSEAGNLLWAESDGSISDLSSRDIAAFDTSLVFITGYFKCKLSEYADDYGQGIFNSIGFEDIYATAYSQQGTRLWMRQIGGKSEDFGHSVSASVDGLPVVAGSFDTMLVIPSSPNMIMHNLLPMTNTSTKTGYCGDTLYDDYVRLMSPGMSNAFITTLLNPSRSSYDYYHRSGSGCNKDPLGVCIADTLMPDYLGCLPDTHAVCSTDYNPIWMPLLAALTMTSDTGTNFSYGPDFNYNWSGSASGQNNKITLNTPGTHQVVVTMTSADGCFTSSDSITYIVHPKPTAFCISDNVLPTSDTAVNYLVQVCAPDSAFAWGGCHDSSIVSGYWDTPVGVFPGDTTQLTQVGQYVYFAVDSNGCYDYHRIVYVPDTSYLLPSLGVVPVAFPDDTARACAQTWFPFQVYDTVGLFQYLPYPPNQLTIDFCVSYNGGVPQCGTSFYPAIPIYADTPGVVTVSFTLVGSYINTCGSDSVTSGSTYTFYLDTFPNPTAVVQLSGYDKPLCPGYPDTIMATGTGNYQWWHYPVVSPVVDSSWFLNDSMLVIAWQDSFMVTSSVTTADGCYDMDSTFVFIEEKPTPVVVADPVSAVICQGDSVKLSVSTQAFIEWYGPNGLISNDSVIYTTIPGVYYVITTDADTCVVTSNQVEVKQYSTPYLSTAPVPYVCIGDSVEIAVNNTAGVVLNWLPPLSGSIPTQWINQPGYYLVAAQGCGNYDTLSIKVEGSATPAVIAPVSPVYLCPGDSVTLTANPGMSAYSWSNGSGNDSIMIGIAGNYYVIITDTMGCLDVSDTVQVISHITPLPLVNDTTVCYGSSPVLTAGGIGVLDWYLTFNAQTPVYTGSSLSPGALTSDTLYYVRQTDSLCTSLPVLVQVLIDSASMPLSLTANSPVCEGSVLQLNGPSFSAANYNWSGPGNFTSALSSPQLSGIQSADAGWYTLQVSGVNCSPVTDSVFVNVLTLPAVDVDSMLIHCEGDSVWLDATTPLPAGMWSGPSGFTGIALDTFIYPAALVHAGYYHFSVNDGTCSADDSVLVVVNARPATPAPSVNSPVCEFDTAFFQVALAGNAAVSWSGPNGFSDSLANSQHAPVLAADSGYYAVTLTENGCVSDTGWVFLAVTDVPDSIVADYDKPLCEGDLLHLFTGAPLGATFTWNGPNGFVSTSSDPQLPNASLIHNGIYYVTVTVNGCTAPAGTVNVIVNPRPAPPSGSSTSPVCSGDTVSLSATHPLLNGIYNWSGPGGVTGTSPDTAFISSGQHAGIWLVSITENGCTSIPDTVVVQILEAPAKPDPEATGPFCEGETVILFTDSTAGATYTWTGPENFTASGATVWLAPVSVSMSGYYIVEAELGICRAGPDTVLLNIHPNPEIELGPDTSLCYSTGFILQLPEGFAFYEWQDGSEETSYLADQSGYYFAVVTDQYGCKGFDKIYLNFSACETVIIPNVFTPNGDGENDRFSIMAEGTTSFHVKIFNRWGQLLYEWHDPDGGWDGRITGSEKLAPEGVYYWRGTFGTSTGLQEKQGFLHLFR